MLLKSLKVKDFRQFQGEQEVTFSADPDKNVTIIMGENGSGKTSLAQAFTWCLYGETDFEDKVLLCKAVSQKMLPNEEETVRVEIVLEHNNVEYEVIREQRYQKDGAGNLKRPSQTVFKIAYKTPDGQREFVKDLETEIRMKEILPKELSRYFFFDGERIDKMSKEIRKGKSKEFAEAVHNLLGLSAFKSALDHLNGRGKSVIRTYNESYDTRSDSKIREYSLEIEEYSNEIDEIEKRLEEIEGEESLAKDVCDDLADRIRNNADSEKLALEKDKLIEKRKALLCSKASQTASLLKTFNDNATTFLSKKLIKDSLQSLSEADKLDKGIPDIHARTVEFLIDRKVCLCGTPITPGAKEYEVLENVLEYIPPQAIGNLIGFLLSFAKNTPSSVSFKVATKKSERTLVILRKN
jgi:DNA sulfur modification protein DndD